MAKEYHTLYNDFHNTSARVRVEKDDYDTIYLTRSQINRANKKLCGMRDCICGGVYWNQSPEVYADGVHGEVFKK